MSVMPLRTRLPMGFSEKRKRTAMSHLDSKTLQRHRGRYLIAVVTDASENIGPERGHFTQSVQLPWPERSRQTPGPGNKVGKKGVCTMCTPWASDRVVLVPDCAGLRRLSGEWRKFGGWNPVRVPPRAQCFPRSGPFWCFFRVHIVHTLASGLMFRVCGVPERPIRLCGGASGYGRPGTASRCLFWVFILVRPSVRFSRSPLHGG